MGGFLRMARFPVLLAMAMASPSSMPFSIRALACAAALDAASPFSFLLCFSLKVLPVQGIARLLPELRARVPGRVRRLIRDAARNLRRAGGRHIGVDRLPSVGGPGQRGDRLIEPDALAVAVLRIWLRGERAGRKAGRLVAEPVGHAV